MSQHIKLPFFWSGHSLMGRGTEFSSAHILRISDQFVPTKEDQAFIITACNNHYQLVEALTNIIDHCEKYFANFGTIGGKETELVERAKSIIDNIKN